MRRVHPRDSTDAFCTCPACGLLGSHLIIKRGFHVGGLRIRPHDGALVSEAPYTQRQCLFCERKWETLW